jgi:malonate decarboxylase gamma subunit
VEQANAPTTADLQTVEETLVAAFEDIQADAARDLSGRLHSVNRAASLRVRERLRAQWH